MPNDCAARGPRIFLRGDHRKISDFLGEKVNFARIIFGEADKNFGESAFGAVRTVEKRRDDGQAQLRELRSAGCGIGPELWRAEP